jgi:hypothetical protein
MWKTLTPSDLSIKKKQLSSVGIGMFCYISTVPFFSTPKLTNNFIKKNEKIGALGLNFILNTVDNVVEDIVGVY